MEEGFEVANACVKVADNHAIAFMFWYRDVQHKYPDNHDGAFLLDEYNRYLVDMEYLEKINTSGNE